MQLSGYLKSSIVLWCCLLHFSFLVYRAEEIANYIKFQDKEMEAFVEERDKLIKIQEEKKAAMKRRQWEEEVELEKEFDAQLTQLMDKYSPHRSDDTAGL